MNGKRIKWIPDDSRTYPNACIPEGLASINDKIPQSLAGADELPNNHANQTETNVYLHHTQNQRNRRGQNDFQKFILLRSAQSGDQFSFFRVHLFKSRIKAYDGAKNGNGHTGYDDCSFICPKPYDKKGRKCRLWKTVEHHQIRFQNGGEFWRGPKQDGNSDSKKHYKEKA